MNGNTLKLKCKMEKDGDLFDTSDELESPETNNEEENILNKRREKGD